MRPSRLLFSALAALNVLAAASRCIPEGGEEVAARASLPAEGATPEKPRGAAVIFRPRGEKPTSAPGPAESPKLSLAAPPAEASIDRGSFTYLGTMTALDGTSIYFFKDGTTDRVYSSGTGGGELTVLEASGKETLIEIHGTKYLVAR